MKLKLTTFYAETGIRQCHFPLGKLARSWKKIASRTVPSSSSHLSVNNHLNDSPIPAFPQGQDNGTMEKFPPYCTKRALPDRCRYRILCGASLRSIQVPRHANRSFLPVGRSKFVDLVNCDDLTNFQCWCGDDISRSLDGDGMWKSKSHFFSSQVHHCKHCRARLPLDTWMLAMKYSFCILKLLLL